MVGRSEETAKSKGFFEDFLCFVEKSLSKRLNKVKTRSFRVEIRWFRKIGDLALPFTNFLPFLKRVKYVHLRFLQILSYWKMNNTITPNNYLDPGYFRSIIEQEHFLSLDILELLLHPTEILSKDTFGVGTLWY